MAKLTRGAIAGVAPEYPERVSDEAKDAKQVGEKSGMEPAIRLNAVDISFSIGGKPPFRAVAGADLEVAKGEFVAIVGPTGSGKSTLLNAAAGLLRPSAGTVEIEGQPLSGLNGRAGYLFQADALMPWKTSRDNVAIALEIAGVQRRDALARADEWLTKVGLRGFGDRYPHMLSGGQRKRVAMAQVLIRDPAILLMDEPFGPLDAQTRLIMGDLLLELWQQDRKAVLFVTHDLEEAISLSDRVVILSTGPDARIIGDFAIPLERPRDVSEIKLSPEFQRIHREIWHLLKEQVLKAYGYQNAGNA